MLSPERVVEIRNFLQVQFSKKYGDEDLKRTDVLLDFLCAYPELMDTFVNDKFLKPLKVLLGEGFVLMPALHVLRNSFGNLHTDTTTIEGQNLHFVLKPEFNAVTVVIYLQDREAQGGGLFVVPGSHKNPDPVVRLRRLGNGEGRPFFQKVMRKLTGDRYPTYSNYSHYEKGGFDLQTRAGDGVIFNMRMLHRGSKATAERKTTKIGLYFHAISNGPLVDEYMRYLRSRPDYRFLQEARNLGPLQAAAERSGFVAL